MSKPATAPAAPAPPRASAPPRAPRAVPAPPRAPVPPPPPLHHHHFNIGSGYIPRALAKRVEKIAKAHGANFYRVNVPGQGWRYWFVVKTETDQPLDPAIEKAVLDEVAAKGLVLP